MVGIFAKLWDSKQIHQLILCPGILAPSLHVFMIHGAAGILAQCTLLYSSVPWERCVASRDITLLERQEISRGSAYSQQPDPRSLYGCLRAKIHPCFSCWYKSEHRANGLLVFKTCYLVLKARVGAQLQYPCQRTKPRLLPFSHHPYDKRFPWEPTFCHLRQVVMTVVTLDEPSPRFTNDPPFSPPQVLSPKWEEGGVGVGNFTKDRLWTTSSPSYFCRHGDQIAAGNGSREW